MSHAPLSPSRNDKNDTLESTIPSHSGALEEVSVVGGIIAGTAMGAIAGPGGALVGAVIGTAVGAVAAIALHRGEAARVRHDQELDDEIGVTSGSLGEARPNAPPARIGAFSVAASGAGGSDESVDNAGPIPSPEPQG